MTKGFSEEFPGCLGVFMECKCAHWILFSHSCVLQPGATGNLTEGGSEVGELGGGKGGVVGASISPAQSALSGHAVRPTGQARSSPNLSLSSLISLFLSLLSSCHYL